jgi:two-component system, sporulation sensor kinase D
MNLYSKKQRWKLILLGVAFLLISASLYFSNSIVTKVSERERFRVTQWAEAIKKKAELVQLTNLTFSQLRDKEKNEMELWSDATKEIFKPLINNQLTDYTLPLKIINQNTSIPVIVYDNSNEVSEHIHLQFDFSSFKKKHAHEPNSLVEKKFNDTLIQIARSWKYKISIEIDKGLVMNCAYTDSKEIKRLEQNRDSLIQAFNRELETNKGAVPVLLLDAKTDSIIATNLNVTNKQPKILHQAIERLRKSNPPIPIIFSTKQNSLLLYDDSPELKKLQYFPYIQFAIISLFIFVGYLIFNTFRKAEQNQVWAGMAKETAHQLGTPLSSLFAWVEYLKIQNIDPEIANEINKDVSRLEQVANRFSKIGSTTQLENVDLINTIQIVLNYLKTRVSSKIIIEFISPENEILVPHNPSLIEWVIENIIKNAVDSMENSGKLTISIAKNEKNVFVDIEDTGKGIAHANFKTIFKPGFTTKKRGWGLGLSLVKRIVNEYHKGNVFVLHSEIDKGTAFRIVLNKNEY